MGGLTEGCRKAGEHVPAAALHAQPTVLALLFLVFLFLDVKRSLFPPFEIRL